jgi:hypothetical protein
VKVLFDHNLPHKLRTGPHTLGKHEIVTASHMGWGYLKNGELPRIAEESGIEVLVTGDQDGALPGSFQTVECGTFSRKKTRGE